MYVTDNSVTSLLERCALVLLLVVTSTLPAHADIPTNGTLELYGKDEPGGQPGKFLCSLDLVTSTTDFTDTSKCANDEAYTFKLINAPSATVIGFFDHPSCDRAAQGDPRFYFIVKTVKNNLTFEKHLNFNNVAATPEGAIVPGSGGVRLEESHVVEQINGKLSCVSIKRSEVPK